MPQPSFIRPSWARSQILAALESIGRPVGFDKLRHVAKLRDGAASYALMQLELRDLVIRERGPKGFLWRMK